MALVECGRGHIYDNSLYRLCPYCKSSGNRVEFSGRVSDLGKTVPSGENSNLGKTVPSWENSDPGKTVPSWENPDPGKTVPPGNGIGKTVSVFQKNLSTVPVVGWLVCISGPDKGKDYHILAKNNTIGRGEEMDICIMGDMTISRINHAKISYDKNSQFYLLPGGGENIIYLNNEPVYEAKKLVRGDILEIGKSRLAFIPFCRKNYNWTEGFPEEGPLRY